MNHRAILMGAHLGALALVATVACGDYTADPKGAGGTSSAAGTSAAAGTTSSTAGTGGSGAPGGSSAGGSASGSGGAAGSGGSGGRETPPEASCDNVTACGGDVAGVWFATSSCLPVSGMADLKGQGIGCMSAPITGKMEVTGNVTIGADGMFSDNTTTTGEVVLELAAACLEVSGTVTECSKLSSPLTSVGYPDVECVDSTVTQGGCTCTATIDQMGSMAWVAFDAPKKGTYTTASNVLTLSTNVGKLDYDYCVEGNFMKVTPATTTIVGDVKGTIVLQKQP